MTLPDTTLIKSRNLSRRDHVLNLLPPLTVVNKKDATMHERLFAEDPPSKNYPENFPSKVLRHLGAWTFYSAPTKGELALLDRSMYDLENGTKKTDTNEKKPSAYNEYDTEKRTQLNHGDGKKRLETTKGKAVKANQKRQIQRKNGDEETSQTEINKKIQQGKSSLTSKSTQSISRHTNLSQKIKRSFSEDRDHNVKATKKRVKRGPNLKRASNKQQKNTEVGDKSQALVSAVEISLKKSRGKVLGGAESGTEIVNEELTVKGHNMAAPDREKVLGKNCKTDKDSTQEAGRVVRGGEEREGTNLKANGRKGNRLRRANQGPHHSMYSSRPCDGNKEEAIVSEKTMIKEAKRSVIRIPLQENESLEETGHNSTTPNIEDLDCHNNGDSRESEKCATGENSRGHLESELLCEKHVTFGAITEKERGRRKKRPKSQTEQKKERKRSGKKQSEISLNKNNKIRT